MPSLSIIIPTNRRAAILSQCLEHIERQTIAKDLEVIVVSDGHDPETVQAISSQRSAVRFFEIPKSQQGVARNRGIQMASADLCLFIGDDIFLAPDACEKHLKIHQSYKLQATSYQLAILGFTTWDPSLEITETMRWLDHTGWQFGYNRITHYAHNCIPRHLQHRFTYTSHLSLPTSTAKEIPFREDVTLYGWEDMEWGMRLRDAGVRLFYEPDAKALHHHRITLEDSLRRMETLGRSIVTLSHINPALDRMPQGWKFIAYKFLAMLPTMRGRHARAFLKGLEERFQEPRTK